MKACRLATCPLAGQPQPLDQFNTYRKADRPGKIYRRSECRTCRSKMRAEWGEENRERDNRNKATWARERYHSDPEFRRAWIARVNAAEKARYHSDPEYRGTHLAYRRDRRRGTALHARASGPAGLVDAASVMEAVRDSGLSYGEIETRAGLSSATLSHAASRKSINIRTALAVLDALGLDPVDVGI